MFAAIVYFRKMLNSPRLPPWDELSTKARYSTDEDEVIWTLKSLKPLF